MPRTLPAAQAETFGRLYVMHNDRVCPMQTLAIDFTTKLYGKATYRGLSAEQVLCGWIFFYNDWSQEPMFKIKGSAVQKILGIDGRYASLNDFITPDATNKLQASIDSLPFNHPLRQKLLAADEKYNLISMLYSGKLLKIFPLQSPMGGISWYSQADELPPTINDTAEYLFIRKYMSYAQELVAFGDMDGLETLFAKTLAFQQQRAGSAMPSQGKIRAERMYNRLSSGRWLAMACITLGLLFFAYSLFRMGRGKPMHRWVRVCAVLWVALLTAFLIMIFVLKWIAGGHVPMAGGFDSMNLMAIAIGIVVLVACRRYETALPIGMMAMGFVQLVAMIGGSNPPITNLMPVHL